MTVWFRKSQVIYRTYQVLAPLMLKVPLDGLYLALVSILLGSLPWLGSVRPKQPKISPLAAGQMHMKTFLTQSSFTLKNVNFFFKQIKPLTKPRQVLLFLGICAVRIDWVHDQRGLDTHD